MNGAHLLRAALLGALLMAPASLRAAQASEEIRDEIGRMEILSGDLDQYRGLIVCAPHADYDGHTGEIVGRIHDITDIPAVRAWRYRLPGAQIWYDVNRPFMRPIVDGELDENRNTTPLAQSIYERYQRMIQEAAGVGEGEPVSLLVDIHGHGARYRRPDGTRPLLEVIEAVAVGFTDDEVLRIQTEYERLARVHRLENPAPMHFYQTDPYYVYDGVEVDFTWTASGARGDGVLRPDRAVHALHFENPGTMRDAEERRPRVAQIYSDLIRFVWNDIVIPQIGTAAAAGEK